ncbi:MAG: hypothetical protein QGH60_24205 [Phycisphaerae bacterium]|jgi:hypothetical protein|nr:hypothetical protein [Phycisphaerae bacterium]
MAMKNEAKLENEQEQARTDTEKGSFGGGIKDALERRTDGDGYTRLLTEDEAIERLALRSRENPKSSLRWLMRMKRLQYVKLARGVYGFRPDDIEDYINQRLRKASA